MAVVLLEMLFVLSPFLPGPGGLTSLTHALFYFAQIGSVIGLPLILIGLIWNYRHFRKNKANERRLTPVLLWMVPLVAFCVSYPIANFARDFSRTIAIGSVQPIVSALESYQQENHFYPDSLSLLVPKYLRSIPKTGIMGLSEWGYAKQENSFLLQFWQPVFVNFNVEIVMYNPLGIYDVDALMSWPGPNGEQWKYLIWD